MDAVKAYFWLTLATKQDDKGAARRRSELVSKLSPDDVTKQEEAVAAWRSKPVPTKDTNTIH